jgi:hypothetical protein
MRRSLNKVSRRGCKGFGRVRAPREPNETKKIHGRRRSDVPTRDKRHGRRGATSLPKTDTADADGATSLPETKDTDADGATSLPKTEMRTSLPSLTKPAAFLLAAVFDAGGFFFEETEINLAFEAIHAIDGNHDFSTWSEDATRATTAQRST